MALDPNQQDDDSTLSQHQRPPPHNNGDEFSRVAILQWQQEQDLQECQVRNDNYEHEIDSLRHVVEEQDSDLKDLQKQVDELRTQVAAFEADLDE